MRAFECYVPGRVVPQGRARHGRGGHVYYPKASTAYRDLLVVSFRAACLYKKPLSRYDAGLSFYRPRLNSDPDNCIKQVMDALVDAGVVAGDSFKHVASLNVGWRYDAAPGLRVQILEATA